MIKTIGVLIALLVVAAVLAAVTLWVYTNRRLEATPVVAMAETVDGQPEEEPVPGTVDTLVVVAGDDGTHFVALLQTGPGREAPVLLALPSDLDVDVPGGGAMRLGQVPLAENADDLVRTVQTYTGVELDHYVVVRPELLPALAAAVGDVESCDDDGCRTLTEGRARELSGAPDTADALPDWVAGQRRALSALAAGIERPRTWLNPLALKNVVDAVTGHLITDAELGALDAVRLLGSPQLGQTPDVRVVPGVVDPDTGVIQARPDDAETLFAALRNRDEMPEDLGVTGPRPLEPEEVDVLVLNGTGAAGLAADVEEELAAEGFEVIATDNADSFDVRRTRIVHGPGGALHAKVVAAAFDDPKLVRRDESPSHDGEDVRVQVTVGRDWERR